MENKGGVHPNCFLCHKNFDNGSNANRFNLQQLLSHLKIKLKLDPNSVFLCYECNKLGSLLYQQLGLLEVTQMKINHLLEQIVSKISTNCSQNSNVLQSLVKEKCISQLNNALHPQIKLKRLTNVRIVIPSPEDAEMSPESSPPSPAPPSPFLSKPEKTFGSVENDDDQSQSLNISIRKSTSRKRLPEKPKACRFCPKILNNFRVSRYHETIFHPDILLINGKLDNTSDSKFLKICQDVLAVHKLVDNRHGCLYCENCYTEIKCLKRHIIENHLPNAIEKVRQLQRIDSQNSTPAKYKGFGLLCQYCSNVFKTGNELKNHRMTSCKILSQPIKLKSDIVSKPEYPKFKVHVEKVPGQKIPCQFCSKTFQFVDMLRIHSNVAHFLQYLYKAKLDSVSNADFELYCQHLFDNHYSRQKVGTKRQCVYCDKSFPFFRTYKSHLIDKHIDILYNKLKELQKEPLKIKIYINERGIKVYKRVCPNCGRWVMRQRLPTHLKFHCKEQKDRGFFKRCKCLKRFFSVADFNKHICLGNKRKRQTEKRRVQCDKCGIQLSFNRLKAHQLEFCSKLMKRPRVYQRRKKVKQNMTDIPVKKKIHVSQNTKTEDNAT